MSVTYGTETLLDSSPAGGFTEPLTAAQVRARLQIPDRSPEDSDETAWLEALISAARDVAETLQDRDLVRKHWETRFDDFWTVEIPLRTPLVAVTSVTYRDSDGVTHALVENIDYIVDTSKRPGIIRPPYDGEWPSFTAWPTSAVTIRFTSGYLSSDAYWLAAGKQVLQGMTMAIKYWLDNYAPGDVGALIQSNYPFAAHVLLSTGAAPRCK